MKEAVVILKKGEGRTIKAGGAWIFDNEIDRIDGDFTNGDIVDVRDFDGYPMGRGFINTVSKITVRMLTRDSEQWGNHVRKLNPIDKPLEKDNRLFDENGEIEKPVFIHS